MTPKPQVYGNEIGAVMVVVLCITALITLLGATAILTTTTDMKIGANYKTSEQAFYIAEAGIQRAIGTFNTVPNWLGSLTNPTTVNVFAGDNAIGKGAYDVRLFENDPIVGHLTIRSAGGATARSSSATIEAVVIGSSYAILDWAVFSCGNLSLEDSQSSINGGGVFGDNIYLKGFDDPHIQNGDVHARGNLKIEDGCYLSGGNAYANGNIENQSSPNPNIDGDATAAGVIDYSSRVSGNSADGVSPDPVPDLCDENTSLPNITVTRQDFDGFRSNATTTFSSDYDEGGNPVYTNEIIKVGANFKLTGSITFQGDNIFIVKDNVEIDSGTITSASGASLTFLIENGNSDLKNSAYVNIGGAVLVGTVDQGGGGLSGGSLSVTGSSILDVSGSVIVVNGNVYGHIDAGTNGKLVVNYQPPSNAALISFDNGVTMISWREVLN